MANKITIPIPQDPIGENFRWRDWLQRLSDTVYGSMAQQDANKVDITGGVISNIDLSGNTIKDATISNSTVKDGTITNNTIISNTIVSDTILNSTINNSTVGAATPSTGKFTSVELDTASPGTGGQYRLTADTDQGTLSLGMGYDSVNLSLGMEEYFPPVWNNTGSDIPNGTLVGFNGVNGDDSPIVVPWIADGTMSSYTIMGLTTMDMPDGEKGIVTKFGYVHDVDTTGTPVSESWSVGDVLYASPTTAGKLTKVKPTAPDLFEPVATVIKKNATAGILLVRVTPEQQLFYGVFSDSTTQALTVADTVYPITMNTTDVANGFSRGSTTSQIIAANAGLYNFQFSLQIRSSTSAQRSVFIWPRVNGNNVANSAAEVTIKSNTDVIVASWNFVISLTAGQYFELVAAADGTGITLASSASQSTPYVRPAIPSIILAVTQVDQ